eukprot:UN02349
MEDFVGTSIQHAEQQIKLLERQYATEMEMRVLQLIESGFLDSDYEGSSGEFSDYESDTDDADIDVKNADNNIINMDHDHILESVLINRENDTNINTIGLLSNNSVSDNSVESIENIMKMNGDNIKEEEDDNDNDNDNENGNGCDQFAFAEFENFMNKLNYEEMRDFEEMEHKTDIDDRRNIGNFEYSHSYNDGEVFNLT